MPGLTQKIFDADSESLYDFVSKNGRGLYIPPYQRGYAWESSNVIRLIDDTIQGLNALLKRPDESVTFLGTIIAMEDQKKVTINPLIKRQVYGQVMSIIDGQQRLTTLLMLCLALLLEIEVQWSDLKDKKAAGSEEAKQWLEVHVNNRLGLLSQMLAEKQPNGEKEFRYFPKMIRAFADTWSYEANRASYTSPIAWLIFEYVRYREQASPDWSKFDKALRASSAGGEHESARRHLVKLLKVMRDKLRALPDEDEFPDLLGIVRDGEKQETLFDEKLPKSMRTAIEAALVEASSAEKKKSNSEEERTRKWWEASTNLMSLLFFAEFALQRITLVVVTATTEDFAFDVFEALNTTGQPLTALETFVPRVVQVVGMSEYNESEEKRQLELAEAYVKRAGTTEQKQKRSADLLVAFALAELGEKKSNNLAEQRRFMREEFDSQKDAASRQEFIRHLAELSRFFDSVWLDDSGELKVGGAKVPDPAAACLRFLVDLNHTITAPLLAQYAAAVGAAKSPEAKASAMSDFCEVVQAVAAFTTFWRSSRSTTDRIDQVYRDLMGKGSTEHGVSPLARSKRGNGPLPSPMAIRNALAWRLSAVKKDGGANITGKAEWVEKTIVQPIWEINRELTRFLLLVAFHDVVENAKGDLCPGKEGSNPTLVRSAWDDPKYNSVEHIAPRSKKGGWSPDLYTDDENERIGNLTLVPASANSSLGDRPWLEKRAIYAALAAKTPADAQAILDELAKTGASVTETASGIHCGSYLPHVHAIGQFAGNWDLEAVNNRGRQIADLAWCRLAPWLGLPTS